MLSGASHHHYAIVIGSGPEGTVNPTLTLIANALCVADIIKRRLST